MINVRGTVPGGAAAPSPTTRPAPGPSAGATSPIQADRFTAGPGENPAGNRSTTNLINGFADNFGPGAVPTGSKSDDSKGQGPSGYKMVYDGQNLTIYDSQGKVVEKFPATSGEPGATPKDQDKKNRGPIPEGDYSLDPEQYQKHGLLRRSGIMGDWGRYGGPLQPNPGTNTHNRSGFQIHGGDKPGSGGCIDLGKNDERFREIIRQHRGKIQLEVRYPDRDRATTPPRPPTPPPAPTPPHA